MLTEFFLILFLSTCLASQPYDDNDFKKVAFDGTTFVAVGDNANHYVPIVYSAGADAKNWTRSHFTQQNSLFLNSVTYIYDYFYVFGGSYCTLARSKDGKKWEILKAPLEFYHSLSNSLKISNVNSDKLLVTSDHSILNSQDGINYNSVDITKLTSAYVNCIAYGNSMAIAGTESNKNGSFIYSTDPSFQNWKTDTTSTHSVSVKSIVSSKKRIPFIAVGYTGSEYDSSAILLYTGSWNLIYSDKSEKYNFLFDITYSEELDLYVVVGSEILLSNLGTSWKKVDKSKYPNRPDYLAFNGVSIYERKIIVCGYPNIIWVSEDSGSTWKDYSPTNF